MVRKPTYKELYDFALFAQVFQSHALGIIKKEDFVFDGSGGRWEKLAFTFYSNLCEIDSRACQMFKDD